MYLLGYAMHCFNCKKEKIPFISFWKRFVKRILIQPVRKRSTLKRSSTNTWLLLHSSTKLGCWYYYSGSYLPQRLVPSPLHGHQYMDAVLYGNRCISRIELGYPNPSNTSRSNSISPSSLQPFRPSTISPAIRPTTSLAMCLSTH